MKDISIDKDQLQRVIKEAVGNILQTGGHLPPPAVQQSPQQRVTTAAKKVLKEAVILMTRPFVMRGEVQSPTTKETHEKIYKGHVDAFNKISSKLDTVPRIDTDGDNSEFRRLKIDESSNMNSVKLHELYFSNTGDLHSEIRADSIPFMRLTKDWGTFDQWQLDFRACGTVSKEGWMVCYFDPFKQQYFNCFVEGDNMNIPLMGIPVLVVDTHHHAWFYDFPGEKLNYLNKSMREINWNVVEMRMLSAELAKLNQIYAIQPVLSAEKDQGTTLPQAMPPVDVISTNNAGGRNEGEQDYHA